MSKISRSQKNSKASISGSQPIFPEAEIQWLTSHPFGSLSLPENAGSKDMRQFLWPDSLNYHNPLNSLLLAQVETLQQLNSADSWFIRDGRIGIFNFFKKFPRPEKLKSQFFIHASAVDLVPASWRSHVKCYSFLQKKTTAHPKKLLICGLACLSAAHESQRADVLARLKKSLGEKNLATMEIHLFMPARHFNLMKGQTIHAEIYYFLFRFFPGRVKIVNWYFVTSQKSFKDFLLVNLNPVSILADSYINNYVSSKGGTVFEIPFIQNLEKIDFQLSNFHGLKTQALPAKAGKSLQAKTSGSNPEHLALPWQDWFK